MFLLDSKLNIWGFGQLGHVVTSPSAVKIETWVEESVILLLQVHDDVWQQSEFLQCRFLVTVQSPILLLNKHTVGVTAHREAPTNLPRRLLF